MALSDWYARLQAKRAISSAVRASAAGDTEAAIRRFEAAAATPQADVAIRRGAHERAAELLAEAGRTDQAIRHLHEALELAPDDAAAVQTIAERLEAAGDAGGAVSAWRRVLDLRPTDPSAHERLARLLADLGRADEALPHLKALTDAAPDDVTSWRRLAAACASAQDGAGEVAAWSQVLRLQPSEHPACERLAELHLEAGRAAEATPFLLALAEGAPDSARPWKRLAAVMKQAGDAKGEVKALQRASAAEPADVQIRERLVASLRALDRLPEAVPHMWAIAEAEPGRIKLWRRLAEQLSEIGDRYGETEAWRRALSIGPLDPQSHERLAKIFEDEGRPADAVPHLRVLAATEPVRAKAWKRLARALTGLDPDAEIEAWQRTLALGGDDLEAHQQLAQLLYERERRPEALPHLKAVVAAARHPDKAWRRLVRILRETGEAEGDIAPWRQVLQLADARDLDALLARMEVLYARIGELKQAYAQTQKDIKATQGALTASQQALDAERKAHRETQGVLRAELAEHRRLVADMQESAQRRLQADAEARYHLAVARTLALIEPPVEHTAGGRGPSDGYPAHAREALEALLAQGATILARPDNPLAAGLRSTQPHKLTLSRRGRTPVIVIAERDAAFQVQARAAITRPNAVVATLDEVVARRSAGALDARAPAPAPDQGPSRLILVISSDAWLRQATTRTIAQTTPLTFAPEFPAALLAAGHDDRIDLDLWLAAAWAAQGRPRTLGLSFDADSFALFARKARSGRAPMLGKTFRRSCALQLTWSDKLLFAADEHRRRAGRISEDFDAGDAQIEVKTYRLLAEADARIEGAIERLDKYQPALVKLYRELFDKQQLARFCRDAGLAVDIRALKDLAESDLELAAPEETRRTARLIGEAVLLLAAVREPDAPAGGLGQYSLARALERLGRHAEALQAYLQAVREAPTYSPARTAAARYLELAGEIDQAEQLLREGLSAGAPDEATQTALLEFYQRCHRPAGVAAVSRLMRREGLARPAITAPALVELGRYQQAAPLLRSLAARATPDSFLSDLLDLPALADSLGALRTAARDDGSPAAQLQLAEALRRLGHLDEALDVYARALDAAGSLSSLMGVEERSLPQFMIVGPPRTGTTLLRRLLDLHPAIGLPSGEPSFFSSRSGERSGSNRRRAPLAWYLGVFQTLAARKSDATVLGEKSPHYFSMADTEMAFARLLFPKLRIVATLRDPVERAWSEIKVQGRMDEAAIIAALNHGRYPNWFAEVLDAGRYQDHLKRWTRHFPLGQIHLIDADELETDVARQADRLFRWLGLGASPREEILALQRGWNNRTPAFAQSGDIVALLRAAYADQPWRAADLTRILAPQAAITTAPRRAAAPRRRKSA